jgi:hypothetical protein
MVVQAAKEDQLATLELRVRKLQAGPFIKTVFTENGVEQLQRIGHTQPQQEDVDMDLGGTQQLEGTQQLGGTQPQQNDQMDLSGAPPGPSNSGVEEQQDPSNEVPRGPSYRGSRDEGQRSSTQQKQKAKGPTLFLNYLKQKHSQIPKKTALQMMKARVSIVVAFEMSNNIMVFEAEPCPVSP